MHGQLTPGGGFQGGVTIASIVATVWFAYGYRVWNQLTDAQRVEPVEALGAAGYALTGIASIVIGGAAFLQNVAPLGRSGAVISGGTIWIVNTCVGIEVTAAFIVLIVEFVHDTRRVVP
jgi:multicomponent Na+:H+ antiporter subunit B